MQESPSSLPADVPTIDDIDQVVVKVLSHPKLLREARHEAFNLRKPLPTEPPQLSRDCDVCGVVMRVLRAQPAVDDPDLQRIVGEGPFDLFWCPHRLEAWHREAQLICHRIRNSTTSPAQRWRLAGKVETLVNSSLQRVDPPEPADFNCTVCHERMVRQPNRFVTRGFASAIGGIFSWGPWHACPNESAEWHAALRRQQSIDRLAVR